MAQQPEQGEAGPINVNAQAVATQPLPSTRIQSGCRNRSKFRRSLELMDRGL